MLAFHPAHPEKPPPPTITPPQPPPRVPQTLPGPDFLKMKGGKKKKKKKAAGLKCQGEGEGSLLRKGAESVLWGVARDWDPQAWRDQEPIQVGGVGNAKSAVDSAH